MHVQLVDPAAYTPPYDHALATALAQAGARVDLITTASAEWDGAARGPSAGPALPYARHRDFYRVSGRAGERLTGAGRQAARLLEHPMGLRRLRSRPSDLTHLQWAPLQELDAFGLPRRRAIVITAHDVLPREARRFQRLAQRAVYARADLVIAHSDHGRQRLMEEAGVAERKIRVIPHGAFAHLTTVARAPLPAELTAGAHPVSTQDASAEPASRVILPDSARRSFPVGGHAPVGGAASASAPAGPSVGPNSPGSSVGPNSSGSSVDAAATTPASSSDAPRVVKPAELGSSHGGRIKLGSTSSTNLWSTRSPAVGRSARSADSADAGRGAGTDPDDVAPHGSALAAELLGHLSAEAPADRPARRRPIVLSFGLIRPYKGTDVLLEAWRQVRADAELWIVGKPRGVDLAELRARADDRVRFVPRFVTDGELATIFDAADLAVLPYREIEQSGVLATALAFGTPVLASSVGAFPEAEALGAAATVAPGDPAALAAAIDRLIADPTERAVLTARGRALALGSWSWEAVAGRHLDAYAELVG